MEWKAQWAGDRGMRMALEVLAAVCQHYEQEARQQAAAARDRQRRHELERIAETLADLVVAPPQTFQAAIQLFWLYSLTGDIRNHGRMDVRQR